MQDKLAALSGKLDATEQEIENLTGTIATTSDARVRAHLDAQLSKRFDMVAELTDEREQAERDLKRLNGERDRVEETLREVRKLHDEMQATGDAKGAAQIRLRLREELRRLVDTIHIAPYGEFRVTQEWVDRTCADLGKYADRARKMLTERIDNKDWRWYLIRYQTGSFAMFRPGAPSGVELLKMDMDSDETDGELKLAGDSTTVRPDPLQADGEQMPLDGKVPTLQELLAELHKLDVPFGRGE